jgi:hypothetical protein
MRYFSPNSKKTPDGAGKVSKITGGNQLRHEGYCYVKLKKYGMWDDEAARKSKLTITKIIHDN